MVGRAEYNMSVSYTGIIVKCHGILYICKRSDEGFITCSVENM
jgi:hypothetical protein